MMNSKAEDFDMIATFVMVVDAAVLPSSPATAFIAWPSELFENANAPTPSNAIGARMYAYEFEFSL